MVPCPQRAADPSADLRRFPLPSLPLQFFSDARESETYLRSLQDSIKRKYSCDHNTSLTRLEDLLQDSMVGSPTSPPPRAGDGWPSCSGPAALLGAPLASQGSFYSRFRVTWLVSPSWSMFCVSSELLHAFVHGHGVQAVRM